MRSLNTWCVVALAACATLGTVACDDDPMDNFGDPAGWALVQGLVSDSVGNPLDGATVAITGCLEPIGGLAGDGVADEDGSYEVEAALPPRGAFTIPDSLIPFLVECRALVDQSVAADSIMVPFYEQRDQVVPLELDLVAR